MNFYTRYKGFCNCVEDNKTISFKIQDNKRCCTNQDCKIDEKDRYGVIKVTCNGTAKPLEEMCERQSSNQSCNSLTSDKYRNFGNAFKRSYIDICKDKRYDLWPVHLIG